MPLANLRRLPMAMGWCKYLRGSCSVICYGKSGLESNFRQLSTAILRQSPLIVPLFFASNGSSLAYFPTQNHKGYRSRSFSVDGNNGAPFSYEKRWEIRFQELVEYKREFGNTLVPNKYPDNPELGRWVNKRRYEYKHKQKGEASRITDERISRLNEIGFVWDAPEAAWEEKFEQLKQYKDEHGDTLVPRNYPNDPQLSDWVSNQRKEYKRKQSGQESWLTDERISRLNDIGFVWDANEAAWEEKFQQLLLYKDEHGDTLVPQNYHNFPQLGIWVKKQRGEYNRKQRGKDSQLTEERLSKLYEIGFVWDAPESAWEEKFQQLKQYKDEHGDTLVPKNYYKFPKLGIWVNTQRVHYKRHQSGKDSQLTPEREARLNEIGFVWDANEAAWQSNYNKLCSFYKNYGHTKIPLQGYNALYRWCMQQRYLKGEGRLQDHRCDQLKKINFDFFTREVAKGSGLIENMIIYELENMGHQFDMTNRVFFGVKNKYRPDGVIFVDEARVIFFEVDEQHHSNSKYSIEREHRRMKALNKEAEIQGFAHVIFVRVSTGNRRQVNCDQSLIQLKFVSKHLHELKSNIQKNRLRIHYIDYPTDHEHVLASKESFDEVHALTSH